MDNQHRKISGYRELSQVEIDLMNAIKAKGAELLDLQRQVVAHLAGQRQERLDAVALAAGHGHGASELDRYIAAEPERWAAIGKTDIQTGIMALVRAVAQPSGV